MREKPLDIPQSRLNVRLTPRASSNAAVHYKDDVLHLRLTAPPVDGAANNACCRFVAVMLDVASSSVTVHIGEKSRDKVLAIAGISQESVNEALLALFQEV